MTLLDLIRPPKKKRRLDMERMFVPVIFANGEDDDIPGLVAACKDEPVQYGEKIYRPGEALEIVGSPSAYVPIRISKGLCLISHDEPAPDDLTPDWVLVRHPKNCRRILFKYCHFISNKEPTT